MLKTNLLILLFSFSQGVAGSYEKINSCVYYKAHGSLDHVVVSLKTYLNMSRVQKCSCIVYLDKFSVNLEPVINNFNDLNNDMNNINISLTGKYKLNGVTKSFKITTVKLSQISNIAVENLNINHPSSLFYSEIANELNKSISTCTFQG